MKLIKRLSLAMMFVCTAAGMTLANNDLTHASNLVLTGNTEGISITPANEDLFLLNNMLLGETAVSGIEVQNTDAYPFTLNVTVKSVERKRQAEVDLLDILDIKVSMDGVEITSFPAKGGNHSLGKFAPGEKVQLDIYLALAGENAGNEYQNTGAELQWIFEAVSDYETPVVPTPAPPGNERTTRERTPVSRTTPRPSEEPQLVLDVPEDERIIDDIPVPLAMPEPFSEDEPIPEGYPIPIDIPDEPVPLAQMPKTGETALYVSIFCGLAAIALGFVTLIADGRSNKREK